MPLLKNSRWIRRHFNHVADEQESTSRRVQMLKGTKLKLREGRTLPSAFFKRY